MHVRRLASALGTHIGRLYLLLLVGCAGTSPGLPFAAATHADRGVADGGIYKVLLSFNGTDGGEPQAGLVDAGGTLYGTTYGGGTYGGGTVFSVSTTGKEKVLHSFGNGTDGYWPEASLINVNGILYGTTARGGGPGCVGSCGTVFSITRDGSEKVLHHFGIGEDGWWPTASLTNVNGTLYGTTAGGGTYGPACGNTGCGTVFRITTAGKEKVLYDFGEGSDAAIPYGGVIAVNDELYGTTAFGGGYDSGTVFSLSMTGKEKLLHSFGAGYDGVRPVASLIDVDGTLFGTTSFGGNGPCGDGCGTVFSVSKAGQEKVVLTFNGTDGAYPLASLIQAGGVLYGTTSGGALINRRCGSAGCGTLFSVSPSGDETVLHKFGHGGDGNSPLSALIEVKGTLYGTTARGGAFKRRPGTMFALKP